MYIYTRNRFSAGCMRHKRLNAVEFTLRKLPLGLLSKFQLLFHHSVGADVIDDCICRCWRHKGQFSSNTSGTRRTTEDSTQPLNSVPSHVVTAATHYLPRRRQFTIGNTVNNRRMFIQLTNILLIHLRRLLNDQWCTIEIQLSTTETQHRIKTPKRNNKVNKHLHPPCLWCHMAYNSK